MTQTFRVGRTLQAAMAVALGLFLSIDPAEAVPPRAAVVALALWDANVFRSEASGAAKVIAQRFGRGGPVIVRVNTRKVLAAGPKGMMSALAAAERGMDPTQDLLFVVLSSHGAPEGIAERGARIEGLLPPDALGTALAQSAFKHKVVIISACYAGIFKPLATDDTLVITAADATHPSFGCEEGNRWTYFGEAFFNQALRHPGTMEQHFDEAKALIKARETAQGFEPSNPQMLGGANVLPLLDATP